MIAIGEAHAHDELPLRDARRLRDVPHDHDVGAISGATEADVGRCLGPIPRADDHAERCVGVRVVAPGEIVLEQSLAHTRHDLVERAPA
jgi:hypothetical protein